MNKMAIFQRVFHFTTFLYICSHVKVKCTTEPPTTPKIDIRKMLIDEGVIPEIIPDCPNEICKVVYNNTPIIPGQHLTVYQTTKPPQVTWNADNDTFHTLYLCATNRWLTESYPPPDPAREGFDYPRKMEWESWVMINIPGCDVSRGNKLADYLYPGYPLVPQIKERYVFLIYKQPYKFDFLHLQSKQGYQFPDSFQVKDFVKMYNLTGPIAINYFTMQWDKEFHSTMSSLQWAWLVSLNRSSTKEYHPFYRTDRIPTLGPKALARLRNVTWGYLIPYDKPYKYV